MRGHFVILLIEIDSCSFENTIRKAILGIVDTIRFYRLYGTCSVNEWIGFVFPKFKKRAYVIKVTVTFDAFLFKFTYKLDKIKKNNVCHVVREVLKRNVTQHERIRSRDLTQELKSEWYMKLADNELRIFGEQVGAIQVSQMKSTKSILLNGVVDGVKVCFKFPINSSDCEAMVALTFVTDAPHFITLTSSTIYGGCYSYPYLPWRPLEEDNVKLCLSNFVNEVAIAIEFKGLPIWM